MIFYLNILINEGIVVRMTLEILLLTLDIVHHPCTDTDTVTEAELRV